MPVNTTMRVHLRTIILCAIFCTSSFLLSVKLLVSKKRIESEILKHTAVEKQTTTNGILNKSSKQFPGILSTPNTATSTTREFNLNIYLQVFNTMGKNYTTLKTFQDALTKVSESEYKASLWNRTLEMDRTIRQTAADNHVNKQPEERKNLKLTKQNINVATIACGDYSRMESMTMLKSAVIFSQDANLNIIAFSDNSTILLLAQSLLELKWTVNQLGWDFTFELHLDWFPTNSSTNGVDFKNMYLPCATQRLFFPSQLLHIDSLIYLDADTIVLSNLTNIWRKFHHMKSGEQLAAMSPNTEFPATGHYTLNSKIPYYGYAGLNAGIALMNLTRMRNFNMEERSIAAHTLHKDKILLADQDIYNIVFHSYPEKLYLLDCTYNFYWVHCGGPANESCAYDSILGSQCFCNATLTRGVHIVHGNMGTFGNEKFSFLVELNKKFEELDLLKDSLVASVEGLMQQFHTLNVSCFSLTSAAMYKNALDYLQHVY